MRTLKLSLLIVVVCGCASPILKQPAVARPLAQRVEPVLQGCGYDVYIHESGGERKLLASEFAVGCPHVFVMRGVTYHLIDEDLPHRKLVYAPR